MKLRISDGAAASLSVLAVTMRILIGFTMEQPGLSGGSWISVLLGGLLALPLSFSTSRILKIRRSECIARSSGISAKLCCAVIFVLSVWESSFALRIITTSANYIALTNSTRISLILPPLFLSLWTLWNGGSALGASARIWNRILFALLILIFILEFRSYRPGWLFPLSGTGVSAVIDGAVRVAGWMSLYTLTALFAETSAGNEKEFSPFMTVLISTVVSAALLFTRNMMAPILSSGAVRSDFSRLDLLLSNGRAPLSMQLPATILWFVGLFYLLLFNQFNAAASLKCLFPKLRTTVILFTVPLASGAISFLKISGNGPSETYSRWLYIVLCSLSLILLTAKHSANGGRQSHA